MAMLVINNYDDGTLGGYVRYYRIRCNIGVREFARRFGLSHGYLSSLEHGQRNPQPEMLNKIANGLAILMGENWASNEEEDSWWSTFYYNMLKRSEQLSPERDALRQIRVIKRKKSLSKKKRLESIEALASHVLMSARVDNENR